MTEVLEPFVVDRFRPEARRSSGKDLIAAIGLVPFVSNMPQAASGLEGTLRENLNE